VHLIIHQGQHVLVSDVLQAGGKRVVENGGKKVVQRGKAEANKRGKAGGHKGESKGKESGGEAHMTGPREVAGQGQV
jgi:hypothetical protein